MTERDSVEIEKDRVRRRKRNKKLGPKLWRWSVTQRQREKRRRRFYWTRKRWARYHDERERKSNSWPRALKSIRLRYLAQAETEAAAAERRRLSAERRRAARAAAALEAERGTN